MTCGLVSYLLWEEALDDERPHILLHALSPLVRVRSRADRGHQSIRALTEARAKLQGAWSAIRLGNPASSHICSLSLAVGKYAVYRHIKIQSCQGVSALSWVREGP
jgi:hypothetical protein